MGAEEASTKERGAELVGADSVPLEATRVARLETHRKKGERVVVEARLIRKVCSEAPGVRVETVEGLAGMAIMEMLAERELKAPLAAVEGAVVVVPIPKQIRGTEGGLGPAAPGVNGRRAR